MSLEPLATAILLATFGALLVISVVFSRASRRVAVPLTLVFLGIGMLTGAEGIGGVPFERYDFAFRLGSTALALILFDGGLNTPSSEVRRVLGPAGVLATVGVVATAGLVAAGAHVLGFAWPHALLLGAIVSSTDAAALFSVLRSSGLHLKHRVGATLEVESGFNDPMAFILTIEATRHLLDPSAPVGWMLAVEVVREIVIGSAIGLGIGWGARTMLSRIRLPAGGLYPALTLGVAFLAFGLPTIAHGSGFLGVYLAGVMVGEGRLPFRHGLLRVHDALGWLSQITMFLVLGLLVVPSRLVSVAGTGLLLALFLAVIARPLAVVLCLLPFRGYARKDVAYVGWVGLRGAVPIILATYPVLNGAPGAARVFDVVFFVVVVNAILPGTTVSWLTRRLGLESGDPPPPAAVLEVESMQEMTGELLSFYVDEAIAPANVALRDLGFPQGASAVLIVRDREMIPPKGRTVLKPGDHVYVFSRPEAKPFLHLLFGRAENP